MSDSSSLRLIVVKVLVLSLLLTLGGRLWYLQVLSSSDFAQAAADNRVRELVTPAPRGSILDASGQLLVRNRTALVVSVNNQIIARQKDAGEAVLRRLSAVIQMPYAELRQRITACSQTTPSRAGTAHRSSRCRSSRTCHQRWRCRSLSIKRTSRE